MTNRLTHTLAHSPRPLLSIFLPAGYPHLNSAITLVPMLQQAGVDFIELGIPFSDPLADGPTIQQANNIAIANGINYGLILEQLATIRTTTTLPIILMGYINPLLQYGIENSFANASAAGADGFILPDLPLHHATGSLGQNLRHHNLSLSLLVSPQTPTSRIQQIDAATTGFIYAVSTASVTGSSNDSFPKETTDYLQNLSSLNLQNPIIVGFGIHSQHTFQQATQHTAGAIIGTHFIKYLQQNPNPTQQQITQYIQSIKP